MTGTVPPVPQIPAGWAPLAADFTTWVTTPYTFLTSKVLFRGQLQGSDPLSAGVYTLAKLDTVLEDPYSGWSATATGSQPAFSWLAPSGCSGWFEVTLTGMTANQASGSAQCGAALYVDGSIYQQAAFSWANNGNTSACSGSVQVPLLGGSDYVQMYIYSTIAVNTPATAGRYPDMEIAWISA